jgi:dienelactone hydrolase
MGPGGFDREWGPLASLTSFEEDAMDLDGFERFEFERDGKTKPVYRRGRGPGVILMHELPGMVPECIDLARAIAAAGYTVFMPLFFGRPGQRPKMIASTATVCLSREFTALSRGRTSPITGWLRALARLARQEAGGPSVGAIGMCLTGGLALALLLEEDVAAPVLCQPVLPIVFPWSGAAQRADLGLDPDHLEAIRARVEREDIPLLGFRFAGDWLCPQERFARLRQEFGDRFLEHQMPGDGHALLTQHYGRLSEEDQEAVWRTLIGFLNDRLKGGQGTIPPKPAPARDR